MSEHKGKTGKVNTIKLTPEVNRVIWTKGSACAGGKAGLEVDTHFVGNNSDIKIQLKDASGKSLSTIESKISGNHFWKEIIIPDNAKDTLTAKVKLPKHNLEMDSNPLRVMPQVKIKNLKWDKNEVKRGEILKMSADVQGIYDDAEAEIQIWEKDPDGAHDLISSIPVIVKKERVEIHWEFQYKESTDSIPSSDESEKGYIIPEYFFRVVVGGLSADSPPIKFKDDIYITLTDQTGNPVKDADYAVEFADGTEKKGKLDNEGKAVIKNIPPGKTKVSFPGIEVKAK